MKLAPREREHAGLFPRLENESGDGESIGDSNGEFETAESIGDPPVPGDIEFGVCGLCSSMKLTSFSVFTDRFAGLGKDGRGGHSEFGCQTFMFTSGVGCMAVSGCVATETVAMAVSGCVVTGHGASVPSQLSVGTSGGSWLSVGVTPVAALQAAAYARAWSACASSAAC